MRRLERYVNAGGKRLRCGYTTGTCAAAATRAAAELLLGATEVPEVAVDTPAGVEVFVEVERVERGDGWVEAFVRKDAGDDADVTDGMLLAARVERRAEPGVSIDGGPGVGRVTKVGLDQAVGEAAINSVPRAMIAEAACEAAQAHGFEGGLAVTISIPRGAELAAQTFNPRLGIEGGLSVLGTSGIVRPMSEEALVASIALELKVLYETGARDLVLVPGNFGHDFAVGTLGLDERIIVSCSNYLGAAIDEAALLGFDSVLLVGHLGKLVKVAAGVMNTHSRVADARLETLAAHAACAGASQETVCAIMEAATTDAALDLLEQAGLLERTMDRVTRQVGAHLAHRAAGRLAIEAVIFSRQRGLLGQTDGAEALLLQHREQAGMTEGDMR